MDDRAKKNPLFPASEMNVWTGVRRRITLLLPPPAAFAAFVPRGREQGGGPNRVGWLREQQYFSSRVLAGSALAESSAVVGVSI